MSDGFTDAELLKVAFDDERLRKELRSSSGTEWSQILEALKVGDCHPNAKNTVEWIKQLARESRDTIATLTASQDHGPYEIDVFGFDQICTVWAPEYGQSHLFLSHEDAISFVLDEWSEFLVNEDVALRRLPASRSANRPSKGGKNLAIKEIIPIRHQLEHHEYSRVSTDKYYRHPQRQSEEGPPISGSQLADSLVNEDGEISAELRKQLNATGWAQLLEKVEVVAKRKRKKSEAESKKENGKFTRAVVKFFNGYLRGKEGNKAELLDAAARAWVWRGLDLDQSHPDYEDQVGAIQRYARQEHYLALKAYLSVTAEQDS
jgi:hypothetical protein